MRGWETLLARALSFVSDISCSQNMSSLASALLGRGLDTRLRERASGALFLVPLHHSAMKLQLINLVLSHWRWEFSTSSNLCLLRIGISGL